MDEQFKRVIEGRGTKHPVGINNIQNQNYIRVEDVNWFAVLDGTNNGVKTSGTEVNSVENTPIGEMQFPGFVSEDVLELILSYIHNCPLRTVRRVNRTFDSIAERIIEESNKKDGFEIAHKKPSTCSGTFPAVVSVTSKIGTSDKAFDGLDDTRWSGHPPRTAWIAVDLQEKFEIHRVEIVFEVAYGHVFDIQTSDDGQTWKTIKNCSDGHEGLVVLDVHGAGRHVKCQLRQGRVSSI